MDTRPAGQLWSQGTVSCSEIFDIKLFIHGQDLTLNYRCCWPNINFMNEPYFPSRRHGKISHLQQNLPHPLQMCSSQSHPTMSMMTMMKNVPKTTEITGRTKAPTKVMHMPIKVAQSVTLFTGNKVNSLPMGQHAPNAIRESIWQSAVDLCNILLIEGR